MDLLDLQYVIWLLPQLFCWILFLLVVQADIDKHTVEEAIGQVLQLADAKNTGYVNSEAADRWMD